jgi:site-specific DNA-methyltransferase (adenine-specific)
MNANVMFSHKSNEWATPQDFFDELNNEFHFTLDPCSTHGNAKCANHYTAEEDGLSKKWGGKQYFAILRMAENCLSGLRSATKKARGQLLLC